MTLLIRITIHEPQRRNIVLWHPEALKVMIADTELAATAEDDERALADLLKEVHDAAGLDGTGYDEEALANLVFVTRTEDEIKDFDAAAHWVGMPEYEPVPRPRRGRPLELEEIAGCSVGAPTLCRLFEPLNAVVHKPRSQLGRRQPITTRDKRRSDDSRRTPRLVGT